MMRYKTDEYQVHKEIGDTERTLFHSALQNFMGIAYEPVAVASSPMYGNDYIYICTGGPISTNPKTRLAAIKIHKNLLANQEVYAQVTGIEEIPIAELVYHDTNFTITCSDE